MTRRRSDGTGSSLISLLDVVRCLLVVVIVVYIIAAVSGWA